jgi:hypothetical protein
LIGSYPLRFTLTPNFTILKLAIFMPNSIGIHPIFLDIRAVILQNPFMPRIARAVAVGLSHHVVQRGNNRENVFFNKKDRVPE